VYFPAMQRTQVGLPMVDAGKMRWVW
jgi:hypothetical protein